MKPTPFAGREAELSLLREATKNLERSRITALYGRRRIGKTRLVEEAYRGFPLLRFEGLECENSRAQKRQFIRTLARHSGRKGHQLTNASDWVDLLMLLSEYVGNKPCVIFFDEFQWMANGRKDLVSKLKYVWDNCFTQKNRVHLILCGSISSFLVNKVVRSRALYGRIDSVIALGPLSLSEAKGGFFRGRGLREALEGFLAVGGVPKYLEMMRPSLSVKLNLHRLAFRPGGFLLDEFDRLFVSHFGRVPYYRSIVEFLAGRPFATRREIADRCRLQPGGRISTFLEDLDMAGFIEAYTPLERDGSSRLKRYRIADPYLDFYFRFIHPARRRIRSLPDGLPLHQALADRRYDIWRGLAFERFCRQHAGLFAKQLGFSAVAYDHGSWFRRSHLREGVQVDLLFKRADRVLTLCEVKFRDRVGTEVIEEVERKMNLLQGFEGYAVEKVLISVTPPAEKLGREGYFARILTIEDLFSVS